jgi:hypothetical protein
MTAVKALRRCASDDNPNPNDRGNNCYNRVPHNCSFSKPVRFGSNHSEGRTISIPVTQQPQEILTQIALMRGRVHRAIALGTTMHPHLLI